MKLATVVAVVALALEAPAPSAWLAGSWAGTISHEGDTTAFALELVPEADGQVRVKATIPSIHLSGQVLGVMPLKTEGRRVSFGPFSFEHDPAAGTLAGDVPAGLAPVYRIPLTLRRVPSIPPVAREAPAGTPARPAWTVDLGAPLWAGPRYANGLVFTGGQDGRVHAVVAATGERRWSFPAGGAVRTRPTVAAGVLFVQADDGLLYALDAATGSLRWRERVVEKPIERLPFDDPKSRYDRFGSDVAVAGERLFLGTHDGDVLCVDAATGARRWAFRTGDAVLAAPAVADGRVVAGSFDGHVYALDAETGRLLWKRDTRGAVVSTPAMAGGRAIVGNRAYDLLALDAASGDVAWKRYVWFSWIESSATTSDGVAYVGSSDAAAVLAVEAATGRRLWTADVFGWAWGQPAVTEDRVYAGTSSQAGYPAGHRAGVVALERASGRPVWRYEAPPAESGAFGFPGSPATGEGLVFASGLDGQLHAFPE